MSLSLTVEPLRERPGCVAVLARHFEREWPEWYGPGGQGSAIADLTEFANPDGRLPVGVVAIARDGSCLGVAALKATSLPGFAHLSPWAGAGFVLPGLRRQGIGALLLEALLTEARRLGFASVYCATSTSASLLERQRWQLLERAEHDGKPIAVYSINLAAPAGGGRPTRPSSRDFDPPPCHERS